MAKPPEIRPVGLSRTGINFVLFSEPGVGKTPLIATGEKTLILDADSGQDSAALMGSTADAWSMENHNDLYEALDYVRHEDHGYKWVWLDSGTIYQEKGLEHIMADLVVVKKHRDVDLPDRGEYRQNYGRILRFVRHMAAQPVNFGITAHVMRDWDIEKLVPQIQGKTEGGPVWSKVCGYMGVVGYLRIGENDKRGKHWVLHTDEYKNYYTKDRYGAIGTLREPTIPKIEALVAKAVKSAPQAPVTTAGKKRKATSGSSKKTTRSKKRVRR